MHTASQTLHELETWFTSQRATISPVIKLRIQPQYNQQTKQTIALCHHFYAHLHTKPACMRCCQQLENTTHDHHTSAGQLHAKGLPHSQNAARTNPTAEGLLRLDEALASKWPSKDASTARSEVFSSYIFQPLINRVDQPC